MLLRTDLPWSGQTVRQRKTGHPVKFELTAQTREAIDAYMRRFGRKPGDVLFASRGNGSRCISTRQYARLLASWIASVGLDPRIFGTHSLRRTKAVLISPDRQPPVRSAATRSHQDREHGPLSRHRGWRRSGDRPADRCLKYLGRADMLPKLLGPSRAITGYRRSCGYQETRMRLCRRCRQHFRRR
jgi:hypothetical protein